MKEVISVFYIDDSSTDRELVMSAFMDSLRNFSFTFAADRFEFEEKIFHNKYDLILTDFNILGFKGSQVIDRVRQIDSEVPIIVLTGTGSEEIAVEVMKKGISDYIIKSRKHIAKLPLIIRSVLENSKIIKERNEMIEIIKINEERLNLALEATSDGIWDWDLIKDRLFVSLRFQSMLGYEPNEIPFNFNDFKNLIHPDDIDVLLRVINFENEITALKHDLLLRFRSKKQGWRWMSNRFKIIVDNEHNLPKRIIGTITDVTEIKETEIELKRINRALRILSKCNEILIKSNNENKLIQEICDKIRETGEYSLVWVGFATDNQEKTISPTAFSGNNGGYLELLNLTYSETEKGSGPTGKSIRSGNIELVRDLRSDQTYIPWLAESLKRGFRSLLVLPLKEKNNTFGALEVISSSVNAFDKEEIKLLKELSDDLSYGIISIRTKENQKNLGKQLLQSQKMDAIGRLAGGIAHDFNNILTVIIGNSDIVLSGLEENNPNKVWINQIKKSAQKAASLTHQLLAFSRKEMIRPKVLNLNLIIMNELKMLKRLIAEDIKLEVDYEPNLKKIIADQAHIEQIIMNLVVNSKDAIPNGGLIKIVTRNVEITERSLQNNVRAKFGQYICMEVSDNGIGISTENMSKIFEPFFTTKELGKGTGLGLSVIYGILDQNNGYLEVESELGHGATFKIFLPAFSDLEVDKEINENNSNNYRGSGQKILICEDEPDILLMVTTTLTDYGYVVHKSMNVHEATEIFMNSKVDFDILFFDLVLPDGNGINLYESLLEINPKLKVLFTSGYADEKAEWSKIQEKKYHFIQKPYEIKDLLIEINKIVSEQSS